MQSIWSSSMTDKARAPYPSLSGDIKTDVLVIGGGMAGVLIAHRLKQSGLACVIAEAKMIGSGTTKNTTAKITAQHGLIYADIIKRSGLEAARQYFDANTRAIGDFRALSEAHPCDFEEKTAYVFSTDRRDKLEREARAYQKLGSPAAIMDDLPLPIKTVGALAMENQAQFHPMKLLSALANELEIYENTCVLNLSDGVAFTHHGKIHAKNIILATHYPLVNIPGLYFMKLYQHRSYVVALKGAPLASGVFVDERQDGHSFRTYGDLLLIGGGDHKTGKSGGGFAELRGLAERAYPNAVEQFHWATQDCMSLDAVPYIGQHRAGSKNLYVATGFNKWGMTGSMVAARLLCDLIVSGRSELEALYAPQRSMFTPQLAVNFGAAAAGLFSLGGPRCTHMGCKLHKNSVEGSWDCACHGSRFDEKGHVVDNPAQQDIRP